MAWVVTLDFQDGYGARDITAYVLKNTFRRSLVWANELSPASSQLTFSIHNNTTIANLFLSTATKDILVTVTKDGSGYFSGIVQNQFEVGLGTRLRPVSVKCVDRGELLRRKIKSTFAWADYEVCTPSATATSIVHALLTLAGFTSGEWNITEVINKTIDYFVIVETEGRTYWDVLEKLLFEFGYTFYFDATGDFRLGELYPATATSTQTFDETNIVGVLSLGKQARRFEGVEVEWCAHKTLTGALVFSDTTGGDETTKCYIPVAASDHHPDGVEDYDVYCEYAVEGYELIYVASAAIDWLGHSDLVLDEFTSYYRRALVDIRNSNGSSTRYITKLDITGTAVVRGDPRFTVCEFVAGTEKTDKITAEWITTSADAKQLASGVMRHYRYGYITYRFASRTLVDPGAIVTVQDPILGMDNKVRIASRVDDERTGLVIYEAYGLEAYVAETDTTTGRVVAPKAAPPPVSPHEVTVAASGYQGVADWYCDGADDDVQIQAANDYLVATYGGGTIRLTEGTFLLEASVYLSSKVWLLGRGKRATVVDRNCNDYSIHLNGSSGTHLEDVGVAGIMFKTTDTNAKAMIYATYVDGLWIDDLHMEDGSYWFIELENCTKVSVGSSVLDANTYGGIKLMASSGRVDGITFSGEYGRTVGGSGYIGYGVYCGSDAVTVSGCLFDAVTAPADFVGVYLYGSEDCIVTGNHAEGCRAGLTYDGTFSMVKLAESGGLSSRNVISNNRVANCCGQHGGQGVIDVAGFRSTGTGNTINGNHCVDNGTMIDHGHGTAAESAPHLTGETTTTATDCSVSMLTGLKVTKTVAAGTGATWSIADGESTSDLHGLVPGTTYRVRASVRIPASGMTYSELTFGLRYYDGGSWTFTAGTPVETYDEYQELTVDVTIPSTATAAHPHLAIAAAAENNEYVNLQDISMTPLGVHNEHDQQYESVTTKNLVWGNSWQNPFAA